MGSCHFLVVVLCLMLFLEKELIAASLSNCSISFDENRCCLCLENDNCTKTTCPDGFQQISVLGVTCNTTMESGDTTLITTSAPNETFTTQTPVSGQDILCVKCNSHEYLNENSSFCEACSPACVSCNGPSAEDCVICKYEFKEKCVAACPSHTRKGNVTVSPEGNTTICVEVPPDDTKDSKRLYMYIGIGAGGGVVLVVIIVVIICVICRKRNGSDVTETRKGTSKSKRTAMSKLIEIREATPFLELTTLERGNDDKPPRPDVTASNTMGNAQPLRRHNYENTESPGPDFAKTIERQTDNVLRYTKDPTLKKEKSKESDDTRELSIYENAAMVRLQQKMDLTHESSENIKQALEVEEVNQLPQAPGAPWAQTTGNVRAPTKQSKSKGGIIKRFSQRVSRKFTSKANSKAKPEEPPTENYIDMSLSEPLEDYENINIAAGNQNKTSRVSDGEVGGHHSAGEIGGNVAKAGSQAPAQGQSVPNDSELEDYENIRFPNGQSVEEEDYENPPELVRKMQNEDVDGLEDYENVEMRKKDETADNEDPYINVTFKNKK